MDHNARRGFDYIGVTAVALIHDGRGKLLLQKRGEQARDEKGAWDLCGGAVEFGDNFETTLRKEMQEELCVTPKSLRFLTTYDAHRTLDGRPSHWVAVVYAAEVDPAEVRIGEPHKIAEIDWFTSDTLPAPLHSQFQKSFRVAHEQGIIL
ncbi:MAG: NUDIX domain-containing protein [Patescibacteria group bacterium]|nr:NUDIX domain-containing protein [Patescibacteria group bacterium]